MTLAGSALLLVGLAGSALAQPSLHAAMLYGDAHADRFEEIAPTSVYVPADTLRDPWLGRDKVLHAAGSFLLTLSAQYVLVNKLDTSEDGALPIAAGTAFSLGLAKEVADSRRRVNPLFSVRDLAADAFGVALAVGLILL
jgi:uncharacterized protein YfiM (DUF2279 family)